MLRIFLLTLLLLMIASFPFISDWYHKRDNNLSTSDINKAIEAYLNDNPQTIIDSVTRYQQKQFEEHQKKVLSDFKNLFEKNKDRILNFNYPSIKNDDSALTVVEFFDASCGHCKRARSVMKELIKDNNKVNYVFRNLPIFGEASHTAAKYGIAVFIFANMEGYENPSSTYMEFYDKLLSYEGKYNKDNLTTFAIESLLITKDKFLDFVDKNEEKIDDMVAETKKLASDLSIGGTPAFIVGDTLIPGFVEIGRASCRERVCLYV